MLPVKRRVRSGNSVSRLRYRSARETAERDPPCARQRAETASDSWLLESSREQRKRSEVESAKASCASMRTGCCLFRVRSVRSCLRRVFLLNMEGGTFYARAE